MVVDVVASRQRRYNSVVRPLVERFRAHYRSRTLAELAADPPTDGLGLAADRWVTIAGVARGLVSFGGDRFATDDELVNAWAGEVEPLRFAPKLDAHVGCVHGMGVALFAYIRMRSGADAVKPDSRVRRALTSFGFWCRGTTSRCWSPPRRLHASSVLHASR